MLEAITKDISKFGDQAPAHLFFTFDQWKNYEANRMMQEMKLEPIDPYKTVLSLYNTYSQYKNGGHYAAMQRLNRYHGNVQRPRSKAANTGG